MIFDTWSVVYLITDVIFPRYDFNWKLTIFLSNRKVAGNSFSDCLRGGGGINWAIAPAKWGRQRKIDN